MKSIETILFRKKSYTFRIFLSENTGFSFDTMPTTALTGEGRKMIFYLSYLTPEFVEVSRKTTYILSGLL